SYFLSFGCRRPAKFCKIRGSAGQPAHSSCRALTFSQSLPFEAQPAAPRRRDAMGAPTRPNWPLRRCSGGCGFCSVAVAGQEHFDYHQTMSVDQQLDLAVSRIAAAIGEPARVRMLQSLMDGHSRTSTELAIVAEVSPSTASIHLSRLKQEHLVKVSVQG